MCLQQENIDEASSRQRTGSASSKRRSTRRTRGAARHDDESQSTAVVTHDDEPTTPLPGMCSIREEDVVDLSMIQPQSADVSKILHNSTNLGRTDVDYLSSSTPKHAGESRQATFISPVQNRDIVQAAVSTSKKKKRLRATENVVPFAITPSPSAAAAVSGRRMRSHFCALSRTKFGFRVLPNHGVRVQFSSGTAE